MLMIGICDDMTAYASKLRSKLTELFMKMLPDKMDDFDTAVFSCADEVTEFLKEKKLDILFLDIDMPRVTGFDLASVLCEKYDDMILVFMSAHDNFVYDSFRYSPFSYLRKSKMEEELPETVKRIIKKVTDSSVTVTVQSVDGDLQISVACITAIQSDKHNYYKVYTAYGPKDSVLCRGALTALEQTLIPYGFYRINSGCLINLEYVTRIVSPSNVLMRDGRTLPVTIRKLPDLKRAYADHVRRRFGV